MTKSLHQSSKLMTRLPLPVVASTLVVFLAGCTATQSPSKTSGETGEAPRLVRKDSRIVWENTALFRVVPGSLQARGNEVCNVGSSKKMKASGYHPSAMQLDGTPFPKGGFLCEEDRTPVIAAAPAPVVAPAPVAAPAPAPKAPDPVPVKPAGPNLAEVSARTQDWARAWASKDLNTYFGFYSGSFKPSNLATQSAWKESRTARIKKPGAITIELSNISSKPLSNTTVETQFTQKYSSSNFKDTSSKTLIWENEGGQWKIVSESNR